MSQSVTFVPPDEIGRNPENPRIIFHEDELESLLQSIAQQGVLVPLTLYQEGKRFVLLDGERRWRCASKLGLPEVPAIIQPKPRTMQNLMMMFAIHNARKDWDPLPTAIKLESLENEYTRRNGRSPKEAELAGIASLSRGEVRRLKKLLSLPDELIDELMSELNKPRSQQEISVDQVLESFKGSESLWKKEVISESQHARLTRSLVDKFRAKVETTTIHPRLLAKIGRGVERGDVSVKVTRKAIQKLINNKRYTIADAFHDTVARAELEHQIEQLADRIIGKIDAELDGKLPLSESLIATLKKLQKHLKRIV